MSTTSGIPVLEVSCNLINNQLTHIERGCRCGAGSVADVNDQVIFEDHEVLDQITISRKGLSSNASRRGDQMFAANFRNEPLQRGLAAAASVFDLLDQTSEEDRGSETVMRARGDIRFENVSFTYGRDAAPALSSVDLHIAPGETLDNEIASSQRMSVSRTA